jgi:hypothetical protein
MDHITEAESDTETWTNASIDSSAQIMDAYGKETDPLPILANPEDEEDSQFCKQPGNCLFAIRRMASTVSQSASGIWRAFLLEMRD